VLLSQCISLKFDRVEPPRIRAKLNGRLAAAEHAVRSPWPMLAISASMGDDLGKAA
jgi:hypothetical protein